MKISSILTLAFASLMVGLTPALDEVPCGLSGSTTVVAAGQYGPHFGWSEEEACDKVLSINMLTDTCKGCPKGEEGCWWGDNWVGSDPVCTVDPVPFTNPILYIATYSLSSAKRGWVSCAGCTTPPG